MAKKLTGVGGVLGNLISENAPATQTAVIEGQPETSTKALPPDSSVEAEGSMTRTHGTRLGRPPGQKTGEGAPKEKATLRLDKRLMDEYRDWSWEERCQLGELVERALVAYRKQRSRRSVN